MLQTTSFGRSPLIMSNSEYLVSVAETDLGSSFLLYLFLPLSEDCLMILNIYVLFFNSVGLRRSWTSAVSRSEETFFFVVVVVVVNLENNSSVIQTTYLETVFKLTETTSYRMQSFE